MQTNLLLEKVKNKNKNPAMDAWEEETKTPASCSKWSLLKNKLLVLED